MAEPAVKQEEPEAVSDKITCQICGESVHVMSSHISKEHPEWIEDNVKSAIDLTPAQQQIENFENTDEYKRILVGAINDVYQSMYPHSPILSQYAAEALEARRAKKAKAEQQSSSASDRASEAGDSDSETILQPLHKVFGVTRSAATRDGDGNELMISVMKPGHKFEYLVPKIDPDYVWDISLLKLIIMGVENKIPMYLWGYAGVGKSTGFKQYCAATNRPLVRVQHTGDTESSHIIGQTLANEKGTYFNPGPLSLAMKHGWLYLADEYDFAFPQVTSVYQPVLENEPLYIKEADEEWRMIEPHPNFYMGGTGNTNGAGDETGLFQGTNLQNAANYERFGIVKEVEYMEPKKEVRLLAKRFNVDKKHVEPIVTFVNDVRTAFKEGKITNTAGQRVSTYIAKNWILTGSYMTATQLALTNRLPEACRKVVEDIAQRRFGD